MIIFYSVLLLATSHKQPTLAEPSWLLLSYCPAATAGAILIQNCPVWSEGKNIHTGLSRKQDPLLIHSSSGLESRRF